MTTRRCYAAAWLAIAALGLAGIPARGEEARVAVVDMARLFREYYKTARADATMKEQSGDFVAEKEKMEDRLRELRDAYLAASEGAANAALSEKARDLQRADAEKKLVELKNYELDVRRFVETSKQELTEQTMRMTRRLAEELREAVGRYSRQKGYDLVLDASVRPAGQLSPLVYAADRFDITEELLKILNQGRPAAED